MMLYGRPRGQVLPSGPVDPCQAHPLPSLQSIVDSHQLQPTKLADPHHPPLVEGRPQTLSCSNLLKL